MVYVVDIIQLLWIRQAVCRKLSRSSEWRKMEVYERCLERFKIEWFKENVKVVCIRKVCPELSAYKKETLLQIIISLITAPCDCTISVLLLYVIIAASL